MAEIRKPAVKIRQGKRILFLTAFTVRDFMTDNFYTVDRLDVKKSAGMQRLLNESRIKSFGKDIISACKYEDEFLPTSVFLATQGSIGYDEDSRKLFFDPSSDGGVCPLDVVDGQHRIEGLRWAVDRDSDYSLLDFPISTVIAPNMTEAERMLQFVVVNTKQERVNPGVAQHIISRFTKMHEIENMPHLPGWLERSVVRGDDDRALTITKLLNRDSDSPWHGKIQLADEKKTSNHTIGQHSFVSLVKNYLLARNHPLPQIAPEEEKRLAILKNFWIAVNNIFVDKEHNTKTVVFKYVGLAFFNAISAPVMNQLAAERSYTVESFEKCIRSAESHIDGDASGIMSPYYWHVGSVAGGLNSGAIAKLAKSFSDALAQANLDDIQI